MNCAYSISIKIADRTSARANSRCNQKLPTCARIYQTTVVIPNSSTSAGFLGVISQCDHSLVFHRPVHPPQIACLRHLSSPHTRESAATADRTILGHSRVQFHPNVTETDRPTNRKSSGRCPKRARQWTLGVACGGHGRKRSGAVYPDL